MEKILREIKGTFDGQNMVVDDGCSIIVPYNYASKSMLVMGDKLVYKITEDGQAYFKQTKRVPSKKVMAEIIMENGELKAEVEYEKFNILKSSQSFFKLQVGDEVVVVIPVELPDFGEKWAAIVTKI